MMSIVMVVLASVDCRLWMERRYELAFTVGTSS
jgi:hypothetical protein